jgi:protein TonB
MNRANDVHVNGVSMRIAHDRYAPYDDPMAKVLGLDAETSGIAAWLGFGSGSTVLMVALMVLASIVAWWHTAHAKAAVTTAEEIEIQKEEPPPPAPTADKAEPKAEHVAPPPRAAAAPPPPPPSPAQAAHVLAQDDKLDFTKDPSFTIPVGTADTFAGGNTSSDGKSTTAQHGPVSQEGAANAGGPPQAANPPPQVQGPDLSKSAGPGRTQWNCGFPPEADTDQIDEANVLVQVDLTADGTPTGVRVLRDPGSGFGPLARQCAMRMRSYQVALDHDGHAIAGTAKFNIHFSR